MKGIRGGEQGVGHYSRALIAGGQDSIVSSCDIGRTANMYIRILTLHTAPGPPR